MRDCDQLGLPLVAMANRRGPFFWGAAQGPGRRGITRENAACRRAGSAWLDGERHGGVRRLGAARWGVGATGQALR